MTVVKICGVTRLEDGLAAAEAGADLLGFNFYSGSARCVSLQHAGDLIRRLREELGAASPRMVGVFVNEPVERILDIVHGAGLDFVQLSGDEPPSAVTALDQLAFKAIRAPDLRALRRRVERYAKLGPDDSAAPRILVDGYHPGAYGGTGQRADWDAVAKLVGSTSNLMLAGGLKPDNVAQAVRHVLPWGVDAASGVESEPGIKDPDAMRAFISAAKLAVPSID